MCIASSRVEHYTSDIGILVRLQCDANRLMISPASLGPIPRSAIGNNGYSITVSTTTFQVVCEVSITSIRIFCGVSHLNAFNRTNFIINSDPALFLINHTKYGSTHYGDSINTNNFYYFTLQCSIVFQRSVCTGNRFWFRVV